MNFQCQRLNSFGLVLEPTLPHLNLAELNIEALRELFLSDQLLVLRGFQACENSADFAKFCARFGEVSVWPFGEVLELVERENPEDHIFANSYLPLHWDGMYRKQVPEYQIFHCVKAPLAGQGGRTTFSNTKLVLEAVSAPLRSQWSRVEATYQRKMEFYDSKTKSPIVCAHPYRAFPVIRYNEAPSKLKRHFVNPPQQDFKGLSSREWPEFHRSLNLALYNPKHFYAHAWQNGDIVIADNYTLLHGREAFTSRSPRHLQRVHVLGNPPLDNPGLKS